MAGFIPDGYQEEGYVRGEEGIFDGVHFTYRPVSAGERAELYSRASHDPKSILERETEVLGSKIIMWDLKHPESGDVVVVSRYNMARMNRRLLSKIMMVVFGDAASDQESDSKNS